MIDFARIIVKSGNGGNGVGSFHKIKGKRYGKADGGDGGNGGNVYFEASNDLSSLDKFRFVKDYKATNGQNGLSRRRRGATGDDLRLLVPVGTTIRVTSDKPQVTSHKSDEPEEADEGRIVYDLLQGGEKVLVARGGQGGRGNLKLRDEFGRRPRSGEKGEEGEEVKITLELKLIADVGLIGLPNAGKSTLLSVLTRAKPEVAPYPFTTLEPNLGVLDFEKLQEIRTGKNLGEEENKKRLILADIPGLIEGASAGQGLGHLFLRHIERTGILVHLIDSSAEGDKFADYQIVRGELRKYSQELAKKPEIIVLSKIDKLSEDLNKIISQFKDHKKKAFAISCVTKEGLESLMSEVNKRLK